MIPVKYKFVILSILFFLLTNSTLDLNAQMVSGEMAKTTIEEHEETTFSIKILGAKDVTAPVVLMDALEKADGIELIKDSNWDTLNVNGDVILQKNIKLTSRDSGFYWVPSLPVSYVAGGKRTTKSTEKIPLTVNPFPLDSPQPRDIKGIKKEPLKFEDFLPLLIVLLVVGSLGLGAYFYWKRRKDKEAVMPPPPVLPAHEVALQKLHKLEEQKLWQQGEIKAFQSELTFIVREYLENRFGIQALESTTEEIVSDLNAKDIKDDQKQQLSSMFRMADMVKFAKAKPPADVHSKLLEETEAFVRNTKKIIIEPIVESNTEES